VSGVATALGQPVAHVSGELVARRRAGAYHQLTLTAPEVAEAAEPGQFVALAVGGETSAALLRRCFSIHRVAAPEGTLDVVVAAHGPGTQWLTGLRAPHPVDVVGPLGQAFPLPDAPVACVLVGGGYGSAPLFWLAEHLRERGCSVQMVLGAATEARLFGVEAAGRCADRVLVTTDDGSSGQQGWVSDVLPGAIRGSGATVVYACGPMGMLESVTEVSAAEGATAHVAVEESMACGIGVCMTCVLPVRGSDGATRMVRSCVEGPVFRGDRVRWDAFGSGWCRVPADAIGAPRGGGH
jgi:dihydroorotate dehydrogenase electron transfer subunit